MFEQGGGGGREEGGEVRCLSRGGGREERGEVRRERWVIGYRRER